MISIGTIFMIIIVISLIKKDEDSLESKELEWRDYEYKREHGLLP